MLVPFKEQTISTPNDFFVQEHFAENFDDGPENASAYIGVRVRTLVKDIWGAVRNDG